MPPEKTPSPTFGHSSLKAGADPKITDSMGLTAMDYLEGKVTDAPNKTMSDQERMEARRLLLVEKNPLNERDGRGRTQLHIAAVQGELEPLRQFIKEGYDPNAMNAKGQTALYEVIDIYSNRISEETRTQIVGVLLDAGASPLPITSGGPDPLLAAFDKKYRSIFDALIGKGAVLATSIENGAHINTDELMSKAIQSQQRWAVDALLEAGVQIKFDDRGTIDAILRANQDGDPFWQDILSSLNPPNELLDTMLLNAANRQNDLHKVEGLLKLGANVNGNPDLGATPLAYAKSYEILDVLLDYGADPNNLNIKWMPALHAHVSNGVKFVERLIAAGADVNMQDRYGQSALHIAVRYDRTDNEAITTLLEAGADPLDRDIHNQTPLHLASNLDKLKLLWDFAPDKNQTLQNEPVINSILSFKSNGMYRHADVRGVLLQRELETINMLEFLIERGFTLEAQDKHRKTPLLIAVQKDQREVVSYLVSAGADFTDSTRLITFALNDKNEGMVRLLLDLGVEPPSTHTDYQYLPLLHLAARNGLYQATVDLLLTGTDPNTVDHEDKSALEHIDQKSPNKNRLSALLTKAMVGEPLPIGPGFNCDEAITHTEKAICASPALSEADYRMARAYSQATMKRRFVTSQTLLEEQRLWLRERSSDCLVDNPERPEAYELMAPCLLNMTQQRAAELKKHVK